MKRALPLLAPGGVSVIPAMGMGGGFGATPAWTFWSPVWGGQHDAKLEDEYHTRRNLSGYGRRPKPDDPTYLVYAATFENAVRDGGMGNRDVMWAARATPDSAIEVEASLVTCHGTDGGISQYFSPNHASARETRVGANHHMSWVFVPPHKTAQCKYCKTHFKRKAGWAPSFDQNLTPEIGDPPVGGCIDPCLVGKKNGEAVKNAVVL
eukprot:TRINITY_DN37996_c0_g1_i1.p2 TRINITY_DN37996_c0_g1~~TRINITY_DN37996_c0_g1_i1.p2  ORF type:complete len:234 (+),score=40.85 TRINITY_DN37996_c0_g1_i1:79-702(+)